MGPTDWTSGERVFGPPSGTVDVDWLVPALLELVPGATAERARTALAEAWQRVRLGEAPPAADALDRAASRVVREAVRAYEG